MSSLVRLDGYNLDNASIVLFRLPESKIEALSKNKLFCRKAKRNNCSLFTAHCSLITCVKIRSLFFRLPEMFEFAPPDFERKIVLPQNLPQVLNTIERPLVFTNGCFDILHRGHVSYLAQARQLGANLIVALNTDASVKRQGKGLDRPINPLENRMAVMAALESVDFVTFFDEDTPFNLIELIKPEILVKGGDWQPENIVGAEQTIARGGKVFSIPFLYDTSTTALVKKIRNT